MKTRKNKTSELSLSDLGIDYIWEKVPNMGEFYYRMISSNRIHITKTKHGDYRVWDNQTVEQVGIFETLKEAKNQAEIYGQIYC